MPAGERCAEQLFTRLAFLETGAFLPGGPRARRRQRGRPLSAARVHTHAGYAMIHHPPLPALGQGSVDRDHVTGGAVGAQKGLTDCLHRVAEAKRAISQWVNLPEQRPGVETCSTGRALSSLSRPSLLPIL